MEAFSLVAKLILNTDEYMQALQEAETEGSNITDPEEPDLGLDKSEFDSVVDEAEDTDVADPEAPELGLDNQPYTDALSDAESETTLFGGSVGDVFDGIKGTIAKAGIAVAIKGIVDSLGEAVDLARSMGDNIDKSSRAMSISTDAYQEWSHVLDINGASITDLNRGLMNMRKFMGGGEPSKEFADAMDKLGLSAKVANGEIGSTEDLLKAAMKTLADFSGDGAERDYLAQAIFGRGGTKLNAMFDGTSEDIDNLIQQAHDLGLVMTEDEVANAAAYNDSITNMNASITAFKTAIVADILPGLTDVANTIAQIVAFFNPRTKQQSLSDIYADQDKQFAEELVTIEGTSDAAETLVDKLLAMGDTSKMTAEQYEIWKGTAESLIALVPTLGGVIDVESGQIDGNSESIKENIKQWENLAKQKALQNLKEAKYQAIMERNKDLIDASIKANQKAADTEKARTEAYHAFSDEMEARGLGSLDFEAGNLDEQISAVMDGLADMGDEGEADALALGAAMAKLGTATTEAAKAQAEVDSLSTELETAKQEYEDWVATAEALYGSASSEADEATEDVNALGTALDNLPTSKSINIDLLTDRRLNLAPKAKGDWSVPFDNFPALLHRGERVLTASQARHEESSQMGSSEVVGAITALRGDLQRLQLVINGKPFGRAVVDYGGDRMNDYIGGSNSRVASGYGT